MKTYHKEIPATLGDQSIPVPCEVSYRYLPPRTATRIDPEDGGVELVGITVDVNGERKELEWTDEAWVDSLIQKIYDYEEAA